jgi:hypothetical protein
LLALAAVEKLVPVKLGYRPETNSLAQLFYRKHQRLVAPDVTPIYHDDADSGSAS